MIVHVVSSESARRALERAALDGRIIVWQDALFEGPLPLDKSGEQWNEARARFWAEHTHGQLTFDAALRWQEKQAADWRQIGQADEVVLWAHAGLGDQLILLRHLYVGLSTPSLCVVHVSARVGGRGCTLSDLAPHQIQAEYAQRRRVTEMEISLAQRAWVALCSNDPSELVELLNEDLGPFPHLKPALWRFLQQFPDTQHGLSRLEFEVLAVVALGFSKLVEIFVHVDQHEEAPHFADVDVWRCLHELSHELHPLVAIDGQQPLPLWNPPKRLTDWTVRITDAGLEVVHGRQDRISLNGFDRYVGGVRLQSPNVVWRWDSSRKALVRVA